MLQQDQQPAGQLGELQLGGEKQRQVLLRVLAEVERVKARRQGAASMHRVTR